MSRTGRIMKKIMLILGKADISEVCTTEVDKMKYFPVPNDEEWKIELINIFLEEKEDGCHEEDENSWLELLCID